MEKQKNKVEAGFLAGSFILVFFWEYAFYRIARYAGSDGSFVHEMKLTFFLRMVEAVSLFSLARFFSDPGHIGFDRLKMLSGFKSGIIWSMIFGLAAFSAIFIMWLTGIEIFKYFRIDFVKKPEEIFWFFAAAGLSGPIAEEIFFRGIVFGYLRRYGFIAASILSTLFFVFAHSSVSVPVTQIVGGLVFCWFYEKTGSLIPPVIIHVTGNMALFMIGIFQNLINA